MLRKEKASKDVVVVTGGFSGDENNALKSTEYLSVSNYTVGWQTGPDLPEPLRKAQMLEDQSTTSLYLVGNSTIYRFFDVDNEWIAKRQLKFSRDGHVAFFLPSYLANCTDMKRKNA